jgi:hypothetical protein
LVEPPESPKWESVSTMVPIGTVRQMSRVQSLDGLLFADAKNCSIESRLHIQANNVSSLRFKIRVVADHITIQALGAAVRLSPEHG